MATLSWADVNLFVGDYDFSGYANKCNLMVEVDALDNTVFGPGPITRTVRAGLLKNSLEHGGWVDMAAGNDAPDARYFAEVGQDNVQVTIAPAGTAEGARAFLGRFTHTQYTPGGAVGDLLAFNVRGDGNEELTRGLVIASPDAAVTVSGAATKQQVGALTATQQMVCALHVVTFNGTSLDVDVRSDADASAGGETVRGSFAQATTVTHEQLLIAGAVTDTYWDVNYTFVGTSCVFIVSLGVRAI